jgi:hypothetical protein
VESKRCELRLRRAYCLAHLDTGKAAAEARALTQGDTTSAAMLCTAASVFSLASAHAKDSVARERYAVQAVALLRQAGARGYFKAATCLDELKKDPDLDPLRPRADFRKLLDELPTSTARP